MASRRSVPILALLVCLAAAAVADPALPGRVSYVLDGDTLVLDVRGARYTVELADIDAPELNQPWGRAAAHALQRRTGGVFAVVQRAMSHAPGRVSGALQIGGRDVALGLVRDGLAWSTVPPPAIDGLPPHAYDEAQAEAQAAGRGLWSDPRPIPPWEWRRGSGPADQSRSNR